METLRRLGAAIVIAAFVAGGFGMVTLDAQGKGKAKGKAKGQEEPEDPRVATCAYLSEVLSYDNLDPTIRAYNEWLFFEVYRCHEL